VADAVSSPLLTPRPAIPELRQKLDPPESVSRFLYLFRRVQLTDPLSSVGSAVSAELDDVSALSNATKPEEWAVARLAPHTTR
jgi:hypothetical protein